MGCGCATRFASRRRERAALRSRGRSGAACSTTARSISMRRGSFPAHRLWRPNRSVDQPRETDRAEAHSCSGTSLIWNTLHRCAARVRRYIARAHSCCLVFGPLQRSSARGDVDDTRKLQRWRHPAVKRIRRLHRSLHRLRSAKALGVSRDPSRLAGIAHHLKRLLAQIGGCRPMRHSHWSV